ncbi:MAG: stage II sporulation protein R [Clostridia bacterium]|jgi:stage II sporulation protein R|nr:stage II sporulation protein R [Clostridia bacterium]
MNTLLNIICSKKVKYTIIFIFLLFLYILVSAFSYVDAVSQNLSNNVFRLHVIANSDSENDQNLKYLVRDNILSYMNSICKDVSTKQEAINIVKNHMEDFKKIAIDTINSEGYDYSVDIGIGNFSFPTKNYGDISLPSGYYDALRIKIGEAKGQNWWCVMFPPLCFVDVSSGIVSDESKDIMKKDLSSEEFSLISNEDNSEISFKFKLIEFLQNVKINLAKN